MVDVAEVLAEVRDLEQSLKDTTFVRGGIDFIPTPPQIALEMVAHLDLRGGETILEPSAGLGALIDAILELRSDVHVAAIELNYNACQVMRNKYAREVQVTVYQAGFMEGVWREFESVVKYSRVIMNPPWSKNQDVKHVLYAWDECLADDGILVALVSKGIMWRRDKATRRLRSLVHDYGQTCGAVTFRELQVSGQIIKLYR